MCSRNQFFDFTSSPGAIAGEMSKLVFPMKAYRMVFFYEQ
jgi:hypothetical protein